MPESSRAIPASAAGPSLTSSKFAGGFPCNWTFRNVESKYFWALSTALAISSLLGGADWAGAASHSSPNANAALRMIVLMGTSQDLMRENGRKIATERITFPEGRRQHIFARGLEF